MTTLTIQFEAHDKNLLVTSLAKIMTSKSFFHNLVILRRPRVANFDDIINITTTSNEAAFKDLKQVKIIRNYKLKCNLYLHFLI